MESDEKNNVLELRVVKNFEQIAENELHSTNAAKQCYRLAQELAYFHFYYVMGNVKIT